MADVAAGSRLGRRRAIGGLLALGASSLLAGCESRIQLPAPLATPTPTNRATQALAPRSAPAQPAIPLGVEFGRVLRLEGVTLDAETILAGGYLRLWLHWQGLEPAQEDWRSIGKVVGAQGRVVAKEDDQIGGRRRVLSRWQPGHRAIDEMRVRIARGAPLGEHGLALGVLRADNQTHVPITAAPPEVLRWDEDAILVGTVEIVAG